MKKEKKDNEIKMTVHRRQEKIKEARQKYGKPFILEVKKHRLTAPSALLEEIMHKTKHGQNR